MNNYMKKQIQTIPYYKTKDQYLSSTLYAMKLRLDSTEWLNGTCFFVFEDEDKCLNVVKKYYAGELRVDPRFLWEAFKTIKSIIFNS